MNPPAFQFYPDDFLAGTMHFTDAEAGLYIRLLCVQWSKGQLPCDNHMLSSYGKGDRWLEFRASITTETQAIEPFSERSERESLPPKQRVNKRRPELAGLIGKAYHAAYVRLQREADRKTK